MLLLWSNSLDIAYQEPQVERQARRYVRPPAEVVDEDDLLVLAFLAFMQTQNVRISGE